MLTNTTNNLIIWKVTPKNNNLYTITHQCILEHLIQNKNMNLGNAELG